MSAPVIVTRAQPGADETAARVAALGHTPLISPALHLEAVADAPVLDLSGADGLIFTSANGVRFFKGPAAANALTAWCVGPATCDAADAAGFTDIRNANGNAKDLAALIRSGAAPGARLIHIANEAAAGQLADTLTQAGYRMTFAAPYRAAPAGDLTPAARAALSDPCTVLIHSAKGAAAFAALAAPAMPRALTAVAVSDAAAAPLKALALVGQRIAARPNEAALMDALQAL